MSFNLFPTSRRSILKLGAGAAVLPFAGLSARAAGPIKTAAIYTVPVEQQWVSRIHKAATIAKDRGDIEYVFSEKVSNTDYERVMREYCEAGYQFIVGEAFAVEDAARAVAKDYPDKAFLIGSSFKPDAAAHPNFAVFDNYIQDASYLSGIHGWRERNPR
jgi:basic membrane protein A and related proteins